MLYTTGFLLSFVSLALWVLFQNNRKVSPLVILTFLLGLGTYLYALFFADAALDVKWWSLSRDFVLLASAVAFLSFFKQKTPLFIALLVGLAFLAYQYYFNVMRTSLYGTPPPTPTLSDSQYAPEGELLLELQAHASPQDIADILEKYDLTARPAFAMQNKDMTDLDDYLVVDVPKQMTDNLPAIIAAFENNNAVEYLENNDVIQIKPIESDVVARKKRPFKVNDPEIEKQWALDQMAMDELYALLRQKKVRPQKTAQIAILDTGIDAQHEDLADNYKSIRSKHDSDPNAHGTHCAGIAAAVTNNGIGIASFAPDNDFVKVSSVKVLSGFGGGTQQGIINGILEAADAGADVISMSLGAPSSSSRRKAYQKAVDYARKKGAIVLAAAGNSNRDAKNYSPANTPGIITVSAVDERLQRAAFSNFVQNVEMGIAAPGVNIFSTIPGNGYKAFNGTSMACPYAAGLVGLMKSIRPDLTAEEAYRILKKSGKKTQSGNETGRFIQPAAAIRLLVE